LLGMMIWAKGGLRAATAPLAIGLALAVATSGSRTGLIIALVSVAAFALLAAASRNALRMVVGLMVGAAFVYGVFQQLGPNTSTAKRAQTIAPGKLVTTYENERGSGAAKIGEYVLRYPLGLGVGSVGPARAVFGLHDQQERLNAETLWNFLILEVGLAGLAVFLALMLSLLWLSITRIRRIADPMLRLNLAAIAAPMFGLFAASFSGAATLGVPAGPYLWFSAGVLSYWLVRARSDPRAWSGAVDTTTATSPTSSSRVPPSAEPFPEAAPA